MRLFAMRPDGRRRHSFADLIFAISNKTIVTASIDLDIRLTRSPCFEIALSLYCTTGAAGDAADRSMCQSTVQARGIKLETLG
jgi:hypothetical protein